MRKYSQAATNEIYCGYANNVLVHAVGQNGENSGKHYQEASARECEARGSSS